MRGRFRLFNPSSRPRCGRRAARGPSPGICASTRGAVAQRHIGGRRLGYVVRVDDQRAVDAQEAVVEQLLPLRDAGLGAVAPAVDGVEDDLAVVRDDVADRGRVECRPATVRDEGDAPLPRAAPVDPPREQLLGQGEGHDEDQDEERIGERCGEGDVVVPGDRLRVVVGQQHGGPLDEQDRGSDRDDGHRPPLSRGHRSRQEEFGAQHPRQHRRGDEERAGERVAEARQHERQQEDRDGPVCAGREGSHRMRRYEKNVRRNLLNRYGGVFTCRARVSSLLVCAPERYLCCGAPHCKPKNPKP